MPDGAADSDHDRTDRRTEGAENDDRGTRPRYPEHDRDKPAGPGCRECDSKVESKAASPADRGRDGHAFSFSWCGIPGFRLPGTSGNCPGPCRPVSETLWSRLVSRAGLSSLSLVRMFSYVSTISHVRTLGHGHL